MENLEKKTVNNILESGWNYEATKQFLHCKSCFEKLRESKELENSSPRDAMNYEIGVYPYIYKDGHKEGVIVVWCKKCKQMVWNSSFLKQRKKEEF